MDDLITWLRAQLDDDEQTARDFEMVAVPHGDDPGDDYLARYEVRFDPARVLREVEAKRRLVELHSPANPDAVPEEGTSGWPDKPWLYCATCGSGEPNEYPTTWPCETLKLLALPFSDRPGYREEWKP